MAVRTSAILALVVLASLAPFHSARAQDAPAPQPAPQVTPVAPGVNPSLLELQRGDEAYASHNYTVALRSYLIAARLSREGCYRCLLGLSLTYVALKDWRDVILNSEKALAVATTPKEKANAHNLRGTGLLALSGQNPANLPEAEKEYRAATEADPPMPPYHFSLAVALLRESHDEEAVQELKKFLDLAPNDPKASLIQTWIADPRRARGQTIPEFQATTSQGDIVSPATLKGKVIVLDFWATWCAPCRAALPDLKDLVKKYPSDRFALISVSQDEDRAAWQDFISKEKMTWPQISDPGGQIFRAFGLQDLPTYVVLSADGTVLDRVLGTDLQRSIGARLKDILEKQPELKAR